MNTKLTAIGAAVIGAVGLAQWAVTDDIRIPLLCGMMVIGFVFNPIFLWGCKKYTAWKLGARVGILIGLMPSTSSAIIPIVIALAVATGISIKSALCIWSHALEIKQRQNAKPANGGAGGGEFSPIEDALPMHQPTVTPHIETHAQPQADQESPAEFGLIDGQPAIQFSVPPFSVLERSTNMVDWIHVCWGDSSGRVAVEPCNLPAAFYRITGE